MGIGGYLVVVNGTNHTWRRTPTDPTRAPQSSAPSSSPQTYHWRFHDTFFPGQSREFYFEWKPHLIQWGDEAGDIRYCLEGTNHTFRLQARAGDRQGPLVKLQIHLDGMTVHDHRKGSTVDLGWKWNRITYLVLTGSNGNFFLNRNIPPDWMQTCLPALGNRTLRTLCIPGSNQSGMHAVYDSTISPAVICSNNRPGVITQSKTISSQLTAGCRFFDIRPFLCDDGQFRVGNFYASKRGKRRWKGGLGQSLLPIIDEINFFTADYNELIMLYITKPRKFVEPPRYFDELDEKNWRRLEGVLSRIRHRFASPHPNVDLSTIPLKAFIGAGRPAVLVICEEGQNTLGPNASQRGFYSPTNFPLNCAPPWNPNVTKLRHLSQPAFDALRKFRRRPKEDVSCLLNWVISTGGSRRGLMRRIVGHGGSASEKAKEALIRDLPLECSEDTYPNILMVNGVDEDLVALTLAISTVFAEN